MPAAAAYRQAPAARAPAPWRDRSRGFRTASQTRTSAGCAHTWATRSEAAVSACRAPRPQDGRRHAPALPRPLGPGLVGGDGEPVVVVRLVPLQRAVSQRQAAGKRRAQCSAACTERDETRGQTQKAARSSKLGAALRCVRAERRKPLEAQLCAACLHVFDERLVLLL